MKTAFILIFLAMLASCSIEKRQARHCRKCPVKSEVKDSSWYREIERLKRVIVDIEGETAASKVKFLPCPDGSMPQIASTTTENGQNLSINSRYDRASGTLNTKAVKKPTQKEVFIPQTVINKGKSARSNTINAETLVCKWRFIDVLIGAFIGFCAGVSVMGLFWFLKKRNG